MAKKKKSRKKSASKANEEKKTLSPNFWRTTIALILFVLALFLLLGGFHTGGSLPKGLFHGAFWALGWAAYIVSIAFIVLGVYKLSAEDKKIPRAKLISAIAAVLFFSSLLFTAFASRYTNGSYISNGHGGTLGKLIGQEVLNVLDRFPASLIFLVFTVITACFAIGISPKVFLKIGNIFKNNSDDSDSELASLKGKTEASSFQMNEGVPVEHHSLRDQTRLASFKNVAQKAGATENRQALTIASDPDWKFPSIDLLNQKQDKADAGDVEGNAQAIHNTFENFNIDVEMEGANIGPRVTQFTLKPPTGVKLTKITALENNLALDLAAHSIRIEAPIPGKRAVGIEVPNIKAATVRLSSIFQSREWAELSGPLGFAIGKDIAGKPVVADLGKMPHILIAGQTGSGKSVMINTLLTSLLYRNSPSDLKLILVDPKQVELKPYDDIPHLLTPVITEPEKCISALKWAVAEMERRYKALADIRKRNIDEYNALKKEEGMPYIVIVIDELADLMMMASRDVESLIVRIAQKARAVGIHLVIATQRPSVDVITGLIKANIPARISFTTASQVDSRTIIDGVGAEKLLGQGDMLLLTADMPKPKRVQGAYIDESETSKVTDFVRLQRPPQYDQEIISQPVQINGKGGGNSDYGSNDVNDEMWRDAVHVVLEARKASTSLLQRRLRIGYGRAARLIETMEEQGIISPADGSRPREVLVSSMDEVFNTGDDSPVVESPMTEDDDPVDDL